MFKGAFYKRKHAVRSLPRHNGAACFHRRSPSQFCRGKGTGFPSTETFHTVHSFVHFRNKIVQSPLLSLHLHVKKETTYGI